MKVLCKVLQPTDRQHSWWFTMKVCNIWHSSQFLYVSLRDVQLVLVLKKHMCIIFSFKISQSYTGVFLTCLKKATALFWDIHWSSTITESIQDKCPGLKNMIMLNNIHLGVLGWPPIWTQLIEVPLHKKSSHTAHWSFCCQYSVISETCLFSYRSSIFLRHQLFSNNCKSVRYCLYAVITQYSLYKVYFNS